MSNCDKCRYRKLSPVGEVKIKFGSHFVSGTNWVHKCSRRYSKKFSNDGYDCKAFKDGGNDV